MSAGPQTDVRPIDSLFNHADCGNKKLAQLYVAFSDMIAGSCGCCRLCLKMHRLHKEVSASSVMEHRL